MTATTTSGPTTDEQLDETFDPVFARIAEGAVDREQDRSLALDEVRALNEVRFGALRVPVELGGYGASVRQLFRQLLSPLLLPPPPSPSPASARSTATAPPWLPTARTCGSTARSTTAPAVSTPTTSSSPPTATANGSPYSSTPTPRG